jgi:hypothetical protein
MVSGHSLCPAASPIPSTHAAAHHVHLASSHVALQHYQVTQIAAQCDAGRQYPCAIHNGPDRIIQRIQRVM